MRQSAANMHAFKSEFEIQQKTYAPMDDRTGEIDVANVQYDSTAKHKVHLSCPRHRVHKTRLYNSTLSKFYTTNYRVSQGSRYAPTGLENQAYAECVGFRSYTVTRILYQQQQNKIYHFQATNSKPFWALPKSIHQYPEPENEITLMSALPQ